MKLALLVRWAPHSRYCETLTKKPAIDTLAQDVGACSKPETKRSFILVWTKVMPSFLRVFFELGMGTQKRVLGIASGG
jgi:hypothetical protein